MNLSPIEREITGKELAMIFKRWSETIPKGYIETIGNNLSLPADDKWISATIKPNKEIKITIDFVKLKTAEGTPSQPPLTTPPTQPTTVPVPVPMPTPMPAQMPVPDLSQLYVKGSLTSTEEGVSFAIKNLFHPTEVIGPITVKIDGKEVSSDKIRILSNVGEKANKDISPSSPLPVQHGETLLIKIDGLRLSKGIHKLDIAVPIRDVGSILISNVDNL